MGYLFAIATLAITLGSGTFLVYTEHYGWAWIPFLIACGVSVTHTKN